MTNLSHALKGLAEKKPETLRLPLWAPALLSLSVYIGEPNYQGRRGLCPWGALTCSLFAFCSFSFLLLAWLSYFWMNSCRRGMAWALAFPSSSQLTSVKPSSGRHSAPPPSTPAEVRVGLPHSDSTQMSSCTRCYLTSTVHVFLWHLAWALLHSSSYSVNLHYSDKMALFKSVVR
jgi:hypothetical protein